LLRGFRLESSRREMRFCNSFRRPFLIAGPAATQMRVPLAALGAKRTAIHFCFCRQLDWQEYSEFSNSAVVIS